MTLSPKNIPVRDRLIFAMDVADHDEARRLVNLLGDSISFYKLGLEFFMAGDYFAFIDWLADKGKKVFVDLKFFDVPNTVASAVRALRGRNATFATVHGQDGLLKAAADEKGEIKILAVTALTSLDDGDLKSLGFQVDAEKLVLSRAERALALGCDGVVSSGLEVEPLRSKLGSNFLVVVPGIRPVSNTDDQKRVVDVEEAFRRGADYIVVGRPIKSAPDPRKAAEDMQARIAKINSVTGR
jgi:orotidine-5'-phosphate decarboxylase